MSIRSGTAAHRWKLRPCAEAGISLIELIMFIVIVSIAVVGILSVLNLTTQKSSDPQIRKQMLAAAEALLEEVELKPFTFCDPDDANAATAAGAADCTGGAGGTNDENGAALAPETPEVRGTYDNVSDYNGLNLANMTDINGVALTGYSASVVVARQQLEGSIPLDTSLRITVTVTHGNASVSLTGYRLRYAPQAVP